MKLYKDKQSRESCVIIADTKISNDKPLYLEQVSYVFQGLAELCSPSKCICCRPLCNHVLTLVMMIAVRQGKRINELVAELVNWSEPSAPLNASMM
jgi:hypothetical protein